MPEGAATFLCPAKINLLLAITGRRRDGFHELVSVVAPLAWGDELRVEPAAAGGFSLECADAEVPRDGTNLVLKAAEAFRAATGWTGGARFFLTKRVPVGAGLGGGSSDAATALRALNQLAGLPAGAATLAALAARVGSDCALFLRGGPVVMRGRGERVEGLPESVAGRLSGRRVLVFKPAFGISTAWAYGRMAAMAPGSYVAVEEADRRLDAMAAALAHGRRPEEFLFNNMEAVAFAKYPALPALLEQLKRDFGLAPRMSGSGSACFALLEQDTDAGPIMEAIRCAWGESAFVAESSLQ